MRDPLRVVVLARAPLPGRTKTRLAPRLGHWGAARLQARLVERTLRTARAARIGRVELHAAPRARGVFPGMRTPFPGDAVRAARPRLG